MPGGGGRIPGRKPAPNCGAPTPLNIGPSEGMRFWKPGGGIAEIPGGGFGKLTGGIWKGGCAPDGARLDVLWGEADCAPLPTLLPTLGKAIGPGLVCTGVTGFDEVGGFEAAAVCVGGGAFVIASCCCCSGCGAGACCAGGC